MPLSLELPVFRTLPDPSELEIRDVAGETCRRTIEFLRRRGLWRDEPEEGLEEPSSDQEPALATLYKDSLRGVISLGPRRGERVVRFFGEAARTEDGESEKVRATYGFNLFARQGILAGDHAGVERLARYILRPPLAKGRLTRRPDGTVVLHMKRAWRDGTTAINFEPLDFMAKLAALVPRPRLNTLRFHGVYAPNARLRAQAVAEPKARAPRKPCSCGPGVPSPQTNRLCWSELLRRTFSVDVLACPRCHSRLQRIAWITSAQAISAILGALGLATHAPPVAPPRSAEDLFGRAA